MLVCVFCHHPFFLYICPFISVPLSILAVLFQFTQTMTFLRVFQAFVWTYNIIMNVGCNIFFLLKRFEIFKKANDLVTVNFINFEENNRTKEKDTAMERKGQRYSNIIFFICSANTLFIILVLLFFIFEEKANLTETPFAGVAPGAFFNMELGYLLAAFIVNLMMFEHMFEKYRQWRTVWDLNRVQKSKMARRYGATTAKLAARTEKLTASKEKH